MVAVDRRTGRVQWRFTGGSDAAMPWGHETGDAFTSSPVVVDGMVLVGTNDGKLYALDAQHGGIRWEARTGAPIWSSPAVADKRVFVGSADGVLYCLGLTNGAQRWRFETDGSRLESQQYGFDRRTIQSSPAVANGIVYVGSRDGFLYAVSADSGKLVWRYDHQTSWVNDSPAVADGVVYVGTSDNSFFHAIDATSGKELWRTRVGGVIWSSPAVSGDLVVFGDGIGRLHALDRRTGVERWMLRTGESVHSSAVIAGDLIIVGSADRALYALRTGKESPQRLVLYDSTLRRASSAQDPDLIARYFENRGFRRVDAPVLKSIADSDGVHRRVVVYAVDAGVDSAVLHRLLSRGAKVVWPSVLPPLIWPPDSATGRRPYSTIAWDAPAKLLDVDFRRSTFDDHAAHATSIGRQLGLDQFRSAWGVHPEGVTRVLATDDWGQAVAWQKSYGGGTGSGFFRVPSDNMLAAYLVAEWWIER
jgi:outer membrane protein assembly factor BamB